MPRAARRESGSSVYHVINRGEGRQTIFEGDVDRAFFMQTLAHLADEEHATLHAWCLMGNHFHLLLEAPLANLKTIMQRLQTSYAGYFNRVYGHDGSVFAGRYRSEAVETDEYLMTVVRYIHENPVKAGISRGLDYPWSSYREYCGNPRYASVSRVLAIFGGLEPFLAFHAAEHGEENCIDVSDQTRRTMSDEAARIVADTVLGEGAVRNLKSLDRGARDEALATLKEHGLGVRQIQRLTGISLGTISTAGRS